jgi:hypothetical protein
MATLYLFPEGPGDETNIVSITGATYHWEAVDDQTDGIPDPDDAGSFVESFNKNRWDRDLYQTQNHTIETGTINNVKIYFRCSAWTSGSAKTSIKISDTVYDYDPDDGVYHGTGYNQWSTHCKTLTTNPYTSSAWTWSDIDACQCGINVWSDSIMVSTACTLVYLEVNHSGDYTPQASSALGLRPTASWVRTFASTISELASVTKYYFRAKACVDGSWSYGEEKSFTTLSSGVCTASCAIGAKAIATRSGGHFTRTATLLKTGLSAAGRYIAGEWREALCAISAIAKSRRHDAHFYRKAFTKAGLRAVTFPMGPHRKLLLRLSAVKRFALDLWVAADKCFHRWRD